MRYEKPTWFLIRSPDYQPGKSVQLGRLTKSAHPADILDPNIPLPEIRSGIESVPKYGVRQTLSSSSHDSVDLWAKFIDIIPAGAKAGFGLDRKDGVTVFVKELQTQHFIPDDEFVRDCVKGKGAQEHICGGILGQWSKRKVYMICGVKTAIGVKIENEDEAKPANHTSEGVDENKAEPADHASGGVGENEVEPADHASGGVGEDEAEQTDHVNQGDSEDVVEPAAKGVMEMIHSKKTDIHAGLEVSGGAAAPAAKGGVNVLISSTSENSLSFERSADYVYAFRLRRVHCGKRKVRTEPVIGEFYDELGTFKDTTERRGEVKEVAEYQAMGEDVDPESEFDMKTFTLIGDEDDEECNYVIV